MKNKVVVITGAASGIGAEFVKQYAKRGAHVALLDRDASGLAKLSEQLQDSNIPHLTVTVDITDKEQVAQAFSKVIEKFKTIDVLVNNAGISHISRFEDTPVAIIEKVMAVNFYGAVYCTHEAINHLIKSKGQIITLSSVAGFSPLYGRTGYSASKHALHGFFNSLQAEVREKGVHMLMACPSFVKTNIEDRTLNEEGHPFGKKKSVIGHVMAPEYVVSKILKAADRKKNIVYISKTSKIARLVSFFLPGIFERKMRNRVRKDF
ncbi:SDR family oxidoreductase [Leptobacterium sp. I13]|uniref:SDR family oxidoreductase n=1 Tax=Leptobacterium meishanense TaxID=3128904 RepID=UPI0030EF6686